MRLKEISKDRYPGTARGRVLGQTLGFDGGAFDFHIKCDIYRTTSIFTRTGL